jgi:hypothetical protein
MTFATELASLESEAAELLQTVSPATLTEDRIYIPFRGRKAKLPHSYSAAEALVSFRNGSRIGLLEWARGFVIEFIVEIRGLVCGKKSGGTRRKATSTTARAAVSAVASWLTVTFSVANPFAIALATFVVTVIGAAALEAFCTATDADVLAQLGR